MKTKFKIQTLGDGVHPLIIAKINGKNCRMVIDTGASRTIFDKERIGKFVGKSELEKSAGFARGAGSAELVAHQIPLNIKIGTLVIKNYMAMAIDLSNINSAYESFNLPPVDAVLGSDILLEHKFVIDFNKEELRLKK